MFKGLKSKLEDEAKKLQATVSQYSENIAQQVRSGVVRSFCSCEYSVGWCLLIYVNGERNEW